MSETESKVISVEVERLHFDLKNPRFPSLANEMDALHAFCSSDHARKTVLLAEDIAQRGLNPAELLIVIEDASMRKGHYIVVEGNRRLAALKLLAIPERATDSPLSTAFQNRIKKVTNEHNTDEVISKITCRLLPDRESADYWISLKHTGENDGVGVVSWNGEEVARFRGNAPGLSILDYVKEQGILSEAAIKGLEKFSVTNLDRLLGDPNVRSAIGVHIQKGSIFILKKQEEFLRAATKIVEDIASKTITVSSIKNKEDRDLYLKSIVDFLPVGPNLEVPILFRGIEEETKDPMLAATDKNHQPSPVKNKIKPNLSNLLRNSLIPKKSAANIYISRVNEVFIELKKMNVREFPNAVSALLRVLIDTTTNEYVEKFKLSITRNTAGQSEFRPRLDLVIKDYLEKTKSKEACLSARNALLQQTGPIFVDALHVHLHGRYEHPQPENLLRGWDMIEVWFLGMWKLLNEGK